MNATSKAQLPLRMGFVFLLMGKAIYRQSQDRQAPYLLTLKKFFLTTKTIRSGLKVSNDEEQNAEGNSSSDMDENESYF